MSKGLNLANASCFWNKGDKTYILKDINAKLSKHLEKFGQWKMISLGRGFYEFSFTSYDDLCLVCALGTANLKPDPFVSFNGQRISILTPKVRRMCRLGYDT